MEIRLTYLEVGEMLCYSAKNLKDKQESDSAVGEALGESGWS